MSATCYMCDARATSQEHAPPICLFPEQSLVGRDLRKNLITVPSCDLHNSKKSEDDEFLRATICLPAAGNSSVATQNFGKVLRGARRSPIKYSSFAPRANAPAPPGMSVFTTDRPRLERCIEHIVKAICFHTYGIKWQLPISMVSPQLLAKSKDGLLISRSSSNGIIEATRAFLSSEPAMGENAEVFLYRIKIHENTLAFAAWFYEHFEIYAASSLGISGVAPNNSFKPKPLRGSA